jgi:hypothetical protein
MAILNVAYALISMVFALAGFTHLLRDRWRHRHIIKINGRCEVEDDPGLIWSERPFTFFGDSAGLPLDNPAVFQMRIDRPAGLVVDHLHTELQGDQKRIERVEKTIRTSSAVRNAYLSVEPQIVPP